MNKTCKTAQNLQAALDEENHMAWLDPNTALPEKMGEGLFISRNMSVGNGCEEAARS